MTARNYSNTATEATLSGAASPTDTSFLLTSFSGYPSAPFTASIERGTSNEEIVLVTAVSVSTVTVTRGYDGTTAKSHAAGAQFLHVVIAKDYTEANQHVNGTAGVHGLLVGSTVVGTTDTQTLTNKTLTTPTLTSPTATGTATLASATLSGALSVAGTSTLAALSASGNASIGGTLTVTGASTLAALTAASAAITGNATVGGTLAVTGTSTLTGAATLSGGATVTGGVTASGLVKGGTVESGGAAILDQTTDPAGIAAKAQVWAKSDGGLYTRSGIAAITRLPVHWGSGTSLPASVLAGDTFVHSGAGAYLRYNGAAWRLVEPPEVANAAARTAISTTWSAILYAGFTVYQGDAGAWFIWNGTAWSKRPDVPALIYSVNGPVMPGSGNVPQGASSTGAINAQGPIAAHLPGPIQIEFRGEVVVAGNSGNTAGQLSLAVANTSAAPTTNLGAQWRFHTSGTGAQVIPYVLTAYYQSDGAAKYMWVLASNDPGSSFTYSIGQGSIQVWQL